MTTCRETTELASRAMDERLSFADRVALRVHLAMCRNCTRFAKQLQDMRRLFREESEPHDDTPGLAVEARMRIKAELQKKLDA
ncbi:MAG: zf-HC2 domain-containing protein [Thiobacillus sp.]